MHVFFPWPVGGRRQQAFEAICPTADLPAPASSRVESFEQPYKGVYKKNDQKDLDECLGKCAGQVIICSDAYLGRSTWEMDFDISPVLRLGYCTTDGVLESMQIPTMYELQ